VPDHPDAAELETLFGVMGRAGDATGYPAVGVTLMRGTRGLASIGSKDILVVGSLDKRLGLAELTRDSVFQFDGSRLKVNLGGPVQRTWSALANGHWKSDVDEANQVLVANNGFSGIVSRISPWHGDRVVVMLVASQSQHLPDLVDRLRESEVNAALQGDLAIYDGDRAPTSFRVGPSMTTGVLPAWAKLRMWFSNHPLLLTLLLFAGVALLAWIVYRGVRGLARRRLASTEQS
jgi:cellulose synthase (UDP-forming)